MNASDGNQRFTFCRRGQRLAILVACYRILNSSAFVFPNQYSVLIKLTRTINVILAVLQYTAMSRRIGSTGNPTLCQWQRERIKKLTSTNAVLNADC